MSDGNGDVIRYTVKELLLDLKADVRAIDAKLDLKADRDSVHQIRNDIAAIQLEQSARRHLIEEFKDVQEKVDSHERRIYVSYGAWLVISAGVVANAAKVWFGL